MKQMRKQVVITKKKQKNDEMERREVDATETNTDTYSTRR